MRNSTSALSAGLQGLYAMPPGGQGKRASHFDRAASGDELTLVPQDAWTVLHHCWSPHEFVNLGGSNNVLVPLPMLPPLTLPVTMMERPSEAAVQGAADFESLHHFFSPSLLTPSDDPSEPVDLSSSGAFSPECVQYRGDALAKPHTKITCIHQSRGGSGGGGGDRSGGHMSMTDVVGKVDFLSLTAARRAADALCNAVVVEDTFRLCTSTGAHRRVIVDRAQTHFFLLFEALHAVFPELGCPTVTKPSDICDLHVDGLVDLLSVHSRKVCGFLPVLYFLFETSLRQFSLYFSKLSDQFELRVKEEQRPFDTTSSAKKVMGFFGLGKKGGNTTTSSSGGQGAGGGDHTGVSSHDVLQRLGDLSTAPDLIADNRTALPERYIVHFSNALENHNNTQLASKAATTLYCSLSEETDALLAVVAALGDLDESFFAPPPCFDESGGEGCFGASSSDGDDECIVAEVVSSQAEEEEVNPLISTEVGARGSDDEMEEGGDTTTTDIPHSCKSNEDSDRNANVEITLPINSSSSSRSRQGKRMRKKKKIAAARMTVSGQELQVRAMVVHNLMHNAATHQQYGAIPIVQTMVVSMHMTKYNAQTSRAHSLRPLLELQTLPDREQRLLAESKKPSKDQYTIGVMTAVVVAQRDRLAQYRSCFLGEVDRMRTKRIDALRSVCIYMAAMTSQLVQCYWQDECLAEPVTIPVQQRQQRRWYDLAGLEEETEPTEIHNGLLLRMPEEEFPTILPYDAESGEIICGDQSGGQSRCVVIEEE